jgi:hypothetical protein
MTVSKYLSESLYIEEDLFIESFLSNLVDKFKPIIPKTADLAMKWFREFLVSSSLKDIQEIKVQLDSLKNKKVDESIFSKGKVGTFLFILLTLFPNAVKASEFISQVENMKQEVVDDKKVNDLMNKYGELVNIEDMKTAIQQFGTEQQTRTLDDKGTLKQIQNKFKSLPGSTTQDRKNRSSEMEKMIGGI